MLLIRISASVFYIAKSDEQIHFHYRHKYISTKLSRIKVKTKILLDLNTKGASSKPPKSSHQF